MARKVLPLLLPLLLAAAGLAGLLLLCVPTRDVREPPALKVHASARASGAVRGAAGRARAGRGGSDRAGLGCARARGRQDPARSAPSPAAGILGAPNRALGPGLGRGGGASGGRSISRRKQMRV